MGIRKSFLNSPYGWSQFCQPKTKLAKVALNSGAPGAWERYSWLASKPMRTASRSSPFETQVFTSAGEGEALRVLIAMNKLSAQFEVIRIGLGKTFADVESLLVEVAGLGSMARVPLRTAKGGVGPR
jgi:hypothetical protein